MNDTFGEQFNPSDQMIGGKLSLVSEWSDDVNIYASIGRGYKAGGFNLGTGFSNDQYADTLIYDPEYLWNYELGSINNLDSNTNLDLVIFYSDRKDQQVMASTQVDANDPNTFTFLDSKCSERKELWNGVINQIQSNRFSEFVCFIWTFKNGGQLFRYHQ